MGVSKPIFTRRAQQDIVDIVDYIIGESPSGARAFIAALDEVCELLVSQPEMGSERSFKNPKIGKVRIFPVGRFKKHLIFYRQSDKSIQIIRIFHASQNITQLN